MDRRQILAAGLGVSGFFGLLFVVGQGGDESDNPQQTPSDSTGGASLEESQGENAGVLRKFPFSNAFDSVRWTEDDLFEIDFAKDSNVTSWEIRFHTQNLNDNIISGWAPEYGGESQVDLLKKIAGEPESPTDPKPIPPTGKYELVGIDNEGLGEDVIGVVSFPIKPDIQIVGNQVLDDGTVRLDLENKGSSPLYFLKAKWQENSVGIDQIISSYSRATIDISKQIFKSGDCVEIPTEARIELVTAPATEHDLVLSSLSEERICSIQLG